MAASRLLGLSLLAAGALAETTIEDSRTTATHTTLSTTEEATPTGSYLSYSSQVSLASTLGTISDLTTAMGTDNATDSQTALTPSTTVTYLTGKGGQTTSTGNMTASATETESKPKETNKTPCNNYPEFCQRKYGNITEVACHNSPFITPNNLAANQQYDVTSQLNDGVRFLQAQIQFPTGSDEPHFCHTSCDILDAGVITDWLTQVTTWVATHPYDVVTILLGNGNYSPPAKYVPYIEKSGILRYIYTPPLAPMHLKDWPTLEEMILKGSRVVMFMDYMANQQAYPWLLDEFSHMWESPFDPVDQDFPCVVQRPPDLPPKEANKRMSLLNHNLNIEIDLLGAGMLVPAREELNRTNNATGFGSLGKGANQCVNKWGKPPTFLNVDYYNYGSTPGTVFEVQAEMNNVTYDRPCCGVATASGNKKAYASELVYSALLMATFWVIS